MVTEADEGTNSSASNSEDVIAHYSVQLESTESQDDFKMVCFKNFMVFRFHNLLV